MVPGINSGVPDGTQTYSVEKLEKYRPGLHAFLLRSLHQNPNEIADLTQEVFLRFLRAVEKGKPISNPEAYVFGIASHMVHDLIDREPYQRVTFNSIVFEEVAEFEQIDDIARRLGMRKDIVEALAKLPTAHRTLLLLVEVNGMTCKEAARVTGYSAKTVKDYVSIARQQMLSLLQDYWNKEESPK